MTMNIPSLNFGGDFSSHAITNQNAALSTSGGKNRNDLEVNSYIEENAFNNGKIPEPAAQNHQIVDRPNDSAEQNYSSRIANSFTQSKEDFQFPSNRTQAVLPQDLSNSERLAELPRFQGAQISNPNTVGHTLSGLLETVHDKAVSYEAKSEAMAHKSKSSPLDQAKNELLSQHGLLVGGNGSTKEHKSMIEQQIDQYIHVMKDSYEYYIFTTLTIDMGKGVSQTANTLTKG